MESTRIKGYNDGKCGLPSKPLKKYSTQEKVEYLEGYGTGAWERRNDVALNPGKDKKFFNNPSVMQAPQLPPDKVSKRKPKLQAPDMRPKKNPAKLVYLLQVQKASGPIMSWNGNRFTNNEPFKRFSRADTAKDKGKELIKKFAILKNYKMWVAPLFIHPQAQLKRSKIEAMRGGTKSNPGKRNNADLDAAAKKLEDFSGHKVSHLETGYSRSNQSTGLIVGELDLVGYRAKRDGKTERYGHHFKKNSRPLLAVTSDGKQLHIVGGQYEFTEAGIEDR